jgi:argininosuccinate lyase
MFAYTAGADHAWDARLLRWDVLGSLGHVEGLLKSRILSARQHQRLQRGLRAALRAVDGGELRLRPEHEDVHTAVEHWVTRSVGRIGEMVHTGRSRNDQVACDVRLYLKDALLTLHAAGRGLVDGLLAFAQRERGTLWPGYTHTRRAMPSSALLWSGAIAEGLLLTLESLPALWSQVDRSPLGSAAGYGVPLPLNREATARALGFGGMDHLVTSSQNSRGRIEAGAVFWCVQLGQDLSRFSSDVILLSTEEFGFLQLPVEFVTGSSIMPHKRNPDVLELTRARVALVEGDLAGILALRSRLTSGYHRDFQLLKEPLIRSVDRTHEMLVMISRMIPLLATDSRRSVAALSGGVLATDEVMRRVEEGVPFRSAYQSVSADLKAGTRFPVPRARDLVARRSSTGSLGSPGLVELRRRSRAALQWEKRERIRFDRAMERLSGRRRR